MKCTTIILVSICVGYLSAEKPVVHLDQEKMGQVMQGLMQCLLEAPVDPEVLIQIRNGGTPKTADEKNLQKFMYCGFIKTGYGKKNGHPRIDKVLELYPKSVDKVQMKKVMEECDSKDGKDPPETIANFMKCLREKSPVKVVF